MKKTLLCFKGHYEESEKTTQRMRKIFADHISDKGLISRIYKSFTCDKKKTKQIK